MKKRQKKVQEFLSALKVGDRVITSGGIHGSITKVNEQSLQLQVAQNVRLDVARSAIVGYQGQAPVVDSPERVIDIWRRTCVGSSWSSLGVVALSVFAFYPARSEGAARPRPQGRRAARHARPDR